MDDGIQFGEVEEAAPNRALRPDRNRHFAVVGYESPDDRDLPIFVDLDVLADMEDHALSDASVELGGVLLGGQYEDEEGRPFVVITDSLRAQHYESTKGSFTFTHDTWSAITREREEFPEELQMVGWYHTHPDWGVFLSGMDMFICDNFFNKKLDVAYVIDPCRGDRGMFQWTGNPSQRVKRTGGFFVTASRFRAGELEHYVAELSGQMPVTTTSQRSAPGGYGAPVVHLHQPQSPPPPPWQGMAIAGALAMQFLLVALIAWKTLVPSEGADAARDDKIAAALEKLDESLSARSDADVARVRSAAQAEAMDAIVSELRGTEDGFVQRLQGRLEEANRLTDDVAARDSKIHELEGSVQDLTSEQTRATEEQDRLKRMIAALETDNEKLEGQLKQTADKLATYQPEKTAKSGVVAAKGEISIWWWVLGGVLAAIVLVAGVWWLGERMNKDETEAEPDEDQSAAGSKSKVQSPTPGSLTPDP